MATPTASVDTAGIFSGASDMKLTNRGKWLGPGLYGLDLKNIELIKPRKGGGGHALIATFTVTTSNNAEHPVGSERVWYQKIGVTPEERETAQKSLFRFLMALIGKDMVGDKAEVESTYLPKAEALLNSMANNPAPLYGKSVRCEVEPIKTKTGGNFSLHRYSPATSA